jgi:hypothetical protein
LISVTVAGDVAVFEVEGWDKLWSLKSRLEIPLAHIRGVRRDPNVAQGWWHGIRAPGTQLPGVITAGTFYQRGKCVFWDVHRPERVIVVELIDERYDELVIEVENPAAAVALLQRSIGTRTS